MNRLSDYLTWNPVSFFKRYRRDLCRIVKGCNGDSGGGTSDPQTFQEITDTGSSTSNLVVFTGFDHPQNISGTHIGGGVLFQGNPTVNTYSAFTGVASSFQFNAVSNGLNLQGNTGVTVSSQNGQINLLSSTAAITLTSASGISFTDIGSNPAQFNTRVKGQDATESNDFVTLGQLQALLNP